MNHTLDIITLFLYFIAIFTQVAIIKYQLTTVNGGIPIFKIPPKKVNKSVLTDEDLEAIRFIYSQGFISRAINEELKFHRGQVTHYNVLRLRDADAILNKLSQYNP